MRYQNGIFSNLSTPIELHHPLPQSDPQFSNRQLQSVLSKLKTAKRPMLLLGSQTMLHPSLNNQLVEAVEKLNVPTWLQGMCRGLLGDNELYIKMDRKSAFARSDCIIVCGVPFDFRSQYGTSIPFGRFIVTVNRDKTDLYLNSDLKAFQSPSVAALQSPSVAVHGDPCHFLIELAKEFDSKTSLQWKEWHQTNIEKDKEQLKKNLVHKRKKQKKADLTSPIERKKKKTEKEEKKKQQKR